jgi:hypothetical protein
MHMETASFHVRKARCLFTLDADLAASPLGRQIYRVLKPGAFFAARDVAKVIQEENHLKNQDENP